MNAIVMPDVHQKTSWKKVYDYIDKVEKVFFVGDYFDHHGDADVYGDDAIANFLEIIELKKKYPDKVCLCFGNHDAHYCMGFEEYSNYQGMNSHKFGEALVNNLEYLDICYRYENFVISHAGISAGWYKKWCDRSEKLGIEVKEDPIETINGWFHAYVKAVKAAEAKFKENAGSEAERPFLEEVWKLVDIFEFPPTCWDPYGEDSSCPPTWIRPNALLVSALFDHQIVGHTGTDSYMGIEGGAPFAVAADVKGVRNHILFIDNTEHNNMIVLDDDPIEWNVVSEKDGTSK